MRVSFDQIKRDQFGQIEAPVLVLKTKHGKPIAPLGNYFELKMELKFNEVSQIEFTLPAWTDGKDTPYYDLVGAESVLQIDPYGIFIIQTTRREGNGVYEKKRCTAYSLEYELAGKQIVFGEGTYPFYDPINPKDTMLGMAMECTRNWKIGHVSSTLYNRYRTFDQTDSKVLDLLLNTVQESYGCVFLFDTYKRTLDVIDVEEAAKMLPIYLSFNNLLKEVNVTEKNDNMATKLSVYGADGVDIRSVNPTGTTEIIDLGYHIARGDIPEALVNKYSTWKKAIYAKTPYYTSLTAMRNSTYTRYLTEKARLTDLEGELTAIDNLRVVNVQGRSVATKKGPASEEGTTAYFDARLEEIAVQYAQKQSEIAAQKTRLESVEVEYESLKEDIKSVNEDLKFERFFTQEELKLLDPYLIEGSYTDSTFAVFDVDISGENNSFTKNTSAIISLKDITAVDIEMTTQWGCQNHHSFSYTGAPTSCPECGSKALNNISGIQRHILAVTGGSITIQGDGYDLSSRLNSGTLEQQDGSEIVFSAFLGSGSVNGKSFPSGNFTCVCKSSFDMDRLLAGMEKNIVTTTDEDTGISHHDISYHGNASIDTTDTSIYFTRNVTEYQKYSVQQDLYKQAEQKLQELAYPIFEFTVNSGNFIWAQEFEPFKNALELGSAVYLRLNDNTLLKPVLLEIHLDFENPNNFQLIFSSQFQTKRPDAVNWIKNSIRQANNTTRQLNTEKLKYRGQEISGAAKAFDDFMKSGLNAAYQQVTAGLEQETKLDSSGLKVGTRGKNEFIHISNGMITLVDENSKSSKMAMGHFYSQEYGQDYYGIMADVIYGPLLAGKGLSIACQGPDGDIQFKADGLGVQLHNGRFYLDHDRGGQIALDPAVGIAIGSKDLYSFDKNGRPVFNTENANFYVDLDGKLILKDIDATGHIHGGLITACEMYIGGKNTAQNCKFGVDANGNIIGLETQNGKLRLDSNGMAYFDNDVNISGNLNLTGNINMSGTINWFNNIPNKQRYAASINGPWHETMQSGDIYCCDWNYRTGTWGAPYKKVGQDGKPGQDGSDGSDADVTRRNIEKALAYSRSLGSSYMAIDSLGSPIIYGGKIFGSEIYAGGSMTSSGVVGNGAMISLTSKGIEISNDNHSGYIKLAIEPLPSIGTCGIISSSSDSLAISGKQIAIGTSIGESSMSGLEIYNGENICRGSWDFSDADVKGLHLTFS